MDTLFPALLWDSAQNTCQLAHQVKLQSQSSSKLFLPWTRNLGNKTIFPVINLYLSSASSSLALVQQIAMFPEIGSFVPGFSGQSWTLL